MIRIRPENMIYFLTACGFFIGLMFCIINMSEPIDIILYTLEITLFFYLLSHVSVMNFTDSGNNTQKFFRKQEFEDVSEYFINEIENRENRMDVLLRPDKSVTPPSGKRKKRHDRADKKKAA